MNRRRSDIQDEGESTLNVGETTGLPSQLELAPPVFIPELLSLFKFTSDVNAVIFGQLIPLLNNVERGHFPSV